MNTVYTIARNSWGVDTNEQEAAVSEYAREKIQAYCDERGYEVEVKVVPETLSFNNKSAGDQEIIDELDGVIERNWVTWLEEAIS